MRKLVQNSGLVAMAGLAAFAITAVGQSLWGVMAIANVKLTPAFPWSALVMPLVLAALVGLPGRPRSAAARRRGDPPRARASGAGLAPRPGPGRWSAAACAVVAAAALWTVMATLVRVPPNVLPDTRGLPLTTLVPMLLVSIVAAPLTEEIAFRGYAMGLLRRRFAAGDGPRDHLAAVRRRRT